MNTLASIPIERDQSDDRSIVVDFTSPDVEANFSDDGEPNQAKDVGRRETKVLFWMKCLVMGILIVAAAVIGFLAYTYASAYQDERFRQEYENEAERLVNYFHRTLVTQIWVGATTSVSLTATSRLGVLNSTFLFPTISQPEFELNAFGNIQLNAVSAVTFGPMLSQQTRRGWEIFQARVLDSFLPDTDFGWRTRTYHDGIFELNITSGTPISVSSTSNRTLNPVWQLYPTNGRRKIQFFDQFSEVVRGNALRVMSALHVPVFSAVLDHETETIFDDFYDSDRPRSLLYVPVFDDTNNTNAVGSVSVEIDWTSLFEGTLRNREAVIQAVLENTCGDVMTFEISMDNVKYIGKGDLHDIASNQFEQISSAKVVMEQVSRMISGDTLKLPSEYDKLFSSILGTKALEYTEYPEGFCAYRIRVYPTSQYQQSSWSSGPLVYAIVIAACFVFAGIVFVMYDYVVESRQHKVMETAVQSRAIVNSLFPSIVRDRMFGMDPKPNKRRSNESDKSVDSTRFMNKLSPKMRVAAWIKGRDAKEESEEVNESIADVFQDTTVIFADIAGFTAWSSERDPDQVFKLLESLYAGFDKIAKRLGVFKVETIGDCYVAVTGLPDPNKNHATTMAKFASECIDFTNSKVQELEVELGPGTSELQIRIGLHSGPVTAGVLRGEKSRFQLFGDTINTASRMESHGMPSAIQVSQSTADLIVEAGKEHWLMKRDDLVAVKGKGRMQTYWCNPKQPLDHSDSACNQTQTMPPIPILSGYARKIRRRLSGNTWDGVDVNSHRESSTVTLESKLDSVIAWSMDVMSDNVGETSNIQLNVDRKSRFDESMGTISTEATSTRTIADISEASDTSRFT